MNVMPIRTTGIRTRMRSGLLDLDCVTATNESAGFLETTSDSEGGANIGTTAKGVASSGVPAGTFGVELGGSFWVRMSPDRPFFLVPFFPICQSRLSAVEYDSHFPRIRYRRDPPVNHTSD